MMHGATTPKETTRRKERKNPGIHFKKTSASCCFMPSTHFLQIKVNITMMNDQFNTIKQELLFNIE